MSDIRWAAASKELDLGIEVVAFGAVGLAMFVLVVGGVEFDDAVGEVDARDSV